MKSRIIISLIYILFYVPAIAENLNIQSLKITLDKKKEITIFQNQVSAEDEKNNQLLTEYAEYDKNLQIFKSIGDTTVITSGGYTVEGIDITIDNNKKIIKSNNPALIQDLEKNKIYLDNFEYSTIDGLFQSIGNIEVLDTKDNKYNFSQIYIDEKTKEIVGTDAKTFLYY